MMGLREEAEERFGKEEFEQYEATMRAMAALLNQWSVFSSTPDGSEVEKIERARWERMIASISDKPEKIAEMIECIVAYAVALQNGSTATEWFAPFGIVQDSVPGPTLWGRFADE